ncbi:hypothetical protein PT974_08191 [Cladobotryum mycophilum]|uniref:GH16 domain-containing protein n=1 Tax=Cladobotryum mycophilum TaxID=491253 RepID=A0ABR0SCN6_9HYPO
MDCPSARSLPCLRTLVIAALAGCVVAKHKHNDGPKPIINGDDCDCFLTNGTEPGYFAKHMFFDFRSLPQYAGVPQYVLNDSQAAIAPVTSDYFASDDWNSTWQLQGWNNKDGKGHGLAAGSTVLMVNSQSNVFIQKNGDKNNASATYLSMRTKRLPEFQSAAAFQSRSDDYQFISIRMLARTIGSPGAVTAMFTYQQGSSDTSVQEADLEVLTRCPREKIQYTNQPGFKSDGSRNTEASHNITLPDTLMWSDWAVHRLDWTPQRSVWFVNGKETANISIQVPKDASFLNFNAWSDGGSWSGNMSVYEEASFDIQWIEMVYNSTGGDHTTEKSVSEHHKRSFGPHGQLVRRKGDNGKCKVVCSIDESPELGKTALLWNSTAARTTGADLEGRMVWVWTLAAGSLLWYWLI